MSQEAKQERMLKWLNDQVNQYVAECHEHEDEESLNNPNIKRRVDDFLLYLEHSELDWPEL